MDCGSDAAGDRNIGGREIKMGARLAVEGVMPQG